MAHQAHSLPWNTLASNLKYRISHHHGGSNPKHLPLKPDIWPLNKPNQEKELAYFTQAFAKHIQEFRLVLGSEANLQHLQNQEEMMEKGKRQSTQWTQVPKLET
jgi:hypothetical protein